MGKVILVGAGPGDAGLLTLRGQEAIAEADCILYDRLIGADILRFAREDCEKIFVGKESRPDGLPEDACRDAGCSHSQEDINRLLAEKAGQYETVVRLKGGDPYVFGRGFEEAAYLLENGISVEVVPGITSAVSVPELAGIPLTHRGRSRSIHIYTAREQRLSDGETTMELPFSEMLRKDATYVFLMGVARLKEIVAGLLSAGRSADTPVAVVQNGSLPTQKTCIGKLSDIAEKAEQEGITPPAVIVVGEVISLNSDFPSAEMARAQKSLAKKRYLLPYIIGGEFSFAGGWKNQSTSRLQQMLEEQGAGVSAFAVGKIVPRECPPDAFDHLTEKDWLVFTSKNGVYSYFWNMKRLGKDVRVLGRAHIACVGARTEAVLREFGLLADVVSERHTKEDLLAQLPADAHIVETAYYENFDLMCRWEDGMADAFAGTDILDGMADERAGADALDGVLFTSASSVYRTKELLEQLGRGTPSRLRSLLRSGGRVYSIGPSTTAAICECFGNIDIKEAPLPGYEGLMTVIAST